MPLRRLFWAIEAFGATLARSCRVRHKTGSVGACQIGSETGRNNSVDQNDVGRRRHRSGCVHDAGVFSATRAAVEGARAAVAAFSPPPQAPSPTPIRRPHPCFTPAYAGARSSWSWPWASTPVVRRALYLRLL